MQPAKMVDQPMGQRVGVPTGNHEKQQIFQQFMIGQAFQPVTLDPLLHPRPMIFMDIALLARLIPLRHRASPPFSTLYIDIL